MNASVFASVVQGPSADVMPWGKHKGKPLGEVPRDYLEWAVRNADAMRPELRAAIELELGMLPNLMAPPPEDATPEEKIIRDLKSAWAKDQARVKELERRVAEIEAELRVARKDRPSDLDAFRRVVKQWFAAMSRKFHPDMGGSAAHQVVVNLCYQDLIRRLET